MRPATHFNPPPASIPRCCHDLVHVINTPSSKIVAAAAPPIWLFCQLQPPVDSTRRRRCQLPSLPLAVSHRGAIPQSTAIKPPCRKAMHINLPLDPHLHPPNGMHQPPPPSHLIQGGKAYSDDMCQHLLQMHYDNYDLREAPGLVALWAARKFPSYSTCVGWIQIFKQNSDICPLRRTGNHHAQREVEGTNLKQCNYF